ncbi:thermonuclease family protein [uncultured Desulfobulbus sp.]|uniref:thermonuclease family protein n=1 Tax=uncultured Desulfobulbus sp. TaxID=239745 RepID=UPI0029C9969B|nr:thermonuclease family protein [uncultured Desulfobulbus sp.]
MEPRKQSICNLILLFFLLWASPAIAWEGTVTRVLDGDSLRVNQGGQIVTIRLYGIDSPEYGQAFWRTAKDATSHLVQGKIVTVEPFDTDRYGRIVALVGVRGRSVNGELVRLGMAWVYPHYCKAQPLCRNLEELEQVARVQELGIWKDRNPVPPWVWKHSKQ